MPPPHCMVCAHAANFERELVCLNYGAYVFLYSSCASFERRERGLPIVMKEEVEGKFESGLVDLRGRKMTRLLTPSVPGSLNKNPISGGFEYPSEAESLQVRCHLFRCSVCELI